MTSAYPQNQQNHSQNQNQQYQAHEQHQQPATEGDYVLGALGGMGTPVDGSGLTRLDLEGPHVLWLVVSGAMDLFAVDAAQQGHWHHLGRLEAGSLLLGPV